MAYDIKKLKEKLVEKGLPELEDLAEKSYEALSEWLVESAIESEGKLDDMAVPFIKMLDEIVKPQIDKIDKVKG